jgi:hypothetical protein
MHYSHIKHNILHSPTQHDTTRGVVSAHTHTHTRSLFRCGGSVSIFSLFCFLFAYWGLLLARFESFVQRLNFRGTCFLRDRAREARSAWRSGFLGVCVGCVCIHPPKNLGCQLPTHLTSKFTYFCNFCFFFFLSSIFAARPFFFLFMLSHDLRGFDFGSLL